MTNETTCPRCESTDIDSPATTDIPDDNWHEHGCNECLYVWGDEVPEPGDAGEGDDDEETIEMDKPPEEMSEQELYDALTR